DVDRDVEGGVADPRADTLDDAADADLLEVHRGHDAEAEPRVVHQVLGGEERAADPHVHRAVLEQELLLERAAERRPVRVRRAEVGVPGVEVGVEVQQRGRPVALAEGAQQRQRDRMVAAQGQEALRPREQEVGGGLDLADGLLDVEGIAANVARVGHLLLGERTDVERGVVVAKEAGGLADGDRAEARPRTVGDARVEGHAEDGDVAALDLVEARQAGEGGRPREARDLQRVDRPLRRVVRLAHRALPSRATAPDAAADQSAMPSSIHPARPAISFAVMCPGTKGSPFISPTPEPTITPVQAVAIAWPDGRASPHATPRRKLAQATSQPTAIASAPTSLIGTSAASPSSAPTTVRPDANAIAPCGVRKRGWTRARPGASIPRRAMP